MRGNRAQETKKRGEQQCQRSSRGRLQHSCTRRFAAVGAAPLMQCIMEQSRLLMNYDANACKHPSMRRGSRQKTSMLALGGNRMDCSYQSESDNKDTSPTRRGKMQAVPAHNNRTRVRCKLPSHILHHPFHWVKRLRLTRTARTFRGFQGFQNEGQYLRGFQHADFRLPANDCVSSKLHNIYSFSVLCPSSGRTNVFTGQCHGMQPQAGGYLDAATSGRVL